MKKFLRFCLAFAAILGILAAVWYYLNPAPNYIEIYNNEEDSF